MTSAKNTSEVSSIQELDHLACIMKPQQQRGGRTGVVKAERQEFSYLFFNKGKPHVSVQMVIMTFESQMDGPTMPFIRNIPSIGDKGFNIPGITATFDINSTASAMFLRWNAINRAAWTFMKFARAVLPDSALTYTVRVVKLQPPRGTIEPVDGFEVMVVTDNDVVSYIDYTDPDKGYITSEVVTALAAREEKAGIGERRLVSGEIVCAFTNFKHKASNADKGGTIVYQEFHMCGPSKDQLRQVGITHPGWRTKGVKPMPEQLNIGNYGLCIQESDELKDIETGEVDYAPRVGSNWIKSRSCVPNVGVKDHNPFIGRASIYLTMITCSSDLTSPSPKYDGRVLHLPIAVKRSGHAPVLEGAYDLTPFGACEEVLPPIGGKAMAAQTQDQDQEKPEAGDAGVL